MSAQALLSMIAPAAPSVPQGSSGEAASGFQSLLATLMNAAAVPTDTPMEAVEAADAEAPDDAIDVAGFLVAPAPIPAPPATMLVTGLPSDGDNSDLPSDLAAAPSNSPVSVATGAAVGTAGGATENATDDPGPAAPKADAAVSTPAPPSATPPLVPEKGSAPRAPEPQLQPTRAAAASELLPTAKAAPDAVVAAIGEPVPPEVPTAAPPAPSAPQPAPAPAPLAKPAAAAPAPTPAPLRALAERTSKPLEAGETAAGPSVGANDAKPTTDAAAAPTPTSVSDQPVKAVEAPQPILPDAKAMTDDRSELARAADAASAPATTHAGAHVHDASLSTLSRATIDATAQIAAQILRKLEGRSTRFEMALTPDDLGRVDVRLDIDSEGRLAARLAFDNPLAATDLRERADELRRQLEDAGFHLADDAFEFTERDSGSNAFDRGRDARGGQNRAFAAASRLNAEIDVAQPPRWMALSLSPSGVDLKV